MADQMLILADGTIIENGNAGLSEGFLWLWLPGWTMMEAAQKAFDPAVMGTIVYRQGESHDATYTGYTVCKNLMQQGEEIAVCMVKG